MYNAHGQEDKYSKSYKPSKSFDFQTSAEYNAKVKRNVIVFLVALSIVICAALILFK